MTTFNLKGKDSWTTSEFRVAIRPTPDRGARIPISWKRGFRGSKPRFPFALTQPGKESFQSKSAGEKCHKSKWFGEILPSLTPGYLFMLGRSAPPKITYVRPVGGPENTSNIGESPNRNNLARPPTRPAEFFVQKLYMAHFRLWKKSPLLQDEEKWGFWDAETLFSRKWGFPCLNSVESQV